MEGIFLFENISPGGSSEHKGRTSLTGRTSFMLGSADKIDTHAVGGLTLGCADKTNTGFEISNFVFRPNKR